MAADGDGGQMPFIGSSISLISKSGIRYEGILFTIDIEQSSIALKNVRSFGTEGRRTDGPQVPASNETYEYIIFRGEDIQDLTVLTQLSEAPAAKPLPNDPAIISGAAPPPPSLYPPPGGFMPPPGAPPPPFPTGPFGPPNPNQGSSPFAPYAAANQWTITPGGPVGAPGGPPPPLGPPPSGPPPPQQPQQQQLQPPSSLAPNVAPTVSLTPQQRAQAPRPDGEQHAQPTANGQVQAPARQPPSSYASAAGGGRGPAGGRGRGPPPGGRGPAGHGAAAAGPGGRGGPGGRSGQSQAAVHANAHAAAGGTREPATAAGGRGGGRGAPGAAAQNLLPIPEDDYDFVEANKKLDKKEIEAEAQEAIKAQVVYKKDDFFDMMSCEALDKMVHQGESDRQQHHHHPGGRLTMAEQRRVDIETFGGVGGVRQWHHGGRGRGRGHHGGRGGGRGGYGGGPGRGGYGGGRGYHGGGGGAGGGNPGGRGNAGPPRGGGGGGRGRGGAQ
eukprot:jgi/Chrzof1/8231/Cz03g02110.t1